MYKLFLLKPKVVFRALVNQQSWPSPTNDSVKYDTVTYGTYTDIQVGMTVLFGSAPGLDDYGRQRIRKPATEDTIYFGRSATGSRDGEVRGVDNAHITVLNDFRIWAVVPYIADDGVIYKDSDIAYSDQTKNNPPKANAGIYMAGDIDASTGKLRVTLPHETNTSFAVADGATITAYNWTLPTGVSLVPPSAATDPQITVDCNPGFYWIALTVTDSNGKTHTARVGVYAHDPNNDSNDVFVKNFTIDNWRITPEGQELTVTILEDIPIGSGGSGADLGGIPDGTLVMMWKDNPISPSDRNHMMFVGWHDYDPSEVRSERTATLKDTKLQCVDVAGRMKRIVGFSQQIEIADDGNPTEWTKMKTPNLDKYLDYLMRWHSTVLDVTDWQWSGTGSTYNFVILGSDKDNLWEQVNTRAKAFVPNRYMTCTRRGQLKVRVDPMLQNPSSRTTTVQWTIDDTVYSDFEYQQQRTPRLHWLRGSAVVAGADRNNIRAVFCYAPGKTPGQGAEEQEAGRQLSPDQDTLNEQEGHRYARLQAHQSHFTIRTYNMIPDGVEPALYEWVRLTIPSSVAARRGLSFTNERGLIHSIDITVGYERGGYTHETSIEWEREVIGQPAETYVPPPPDDIDYNWGDWELQPPPTPTQLPDQVVCYIAGKSIYATSNFRDGQTTHWVQTVVLPSDDEAVDACFDPLSPRFQGTGTELNGWIAGKKRIYRFVNALGDLPGFPGSPSASSVYTFAAETSWRTIQCVGIGSSPGTASIGCVSRYLGTPNTIKFVGSQNSGTSWTSETTVGDSHQMDNSHGWPQLWMSSSTLGKVATTVSDSVLTILTFCNGQTSWSGYLTKLAVSTDFGSTWTKSDIISADRLFYNSLGGGLHSLDDGTNFMLGILSNTYAITPPLTIAIPPGCNCFGKVDYTADDSKCVAVVVGNTVQEPGFCIPTECNAQNRPKHGERRWVAYGPRYKKSSFRTLDSNPSYKVFVAASAPGNYELRTAPACGWDNIVAYGYELGVDYRIFLTGDGGTTWVDISDGPDGILNPKTGKRGWYNNGNSLPQEISFHPNSPNVMYVWGKNFIGYTADYGTTWKDCRGNVKFPGDIVIVQASGNA